MLMHLKWDQLSPFPFVSFTKIFAINKDELIASACSGIYTFSKNKNEWNKIFDHEANLFDCDTDFFNGSAYDKMHQIMYFCSANSSADGDKLFRFDVKTGKKSTLAKIYFDNLIFAEKKLHTIGNGTVSFYDGTMQKFNKINEQQRLRFPNPLIYLKSQKCLLSFGAVIQNHRDNSVYNLTDSLHQFSFLDGKWTTLNAKMPKKLMWFGTVKCKNERHIIQFSGRDTGADSDFTDDIFIFDTRAHSFTKSKIRCPRKEEYYGTMTSDIKRNETLCFAFVNDCYKGKRFGNMQLLPFYLIQFVNEYICYEELHLFSRLSQEHWKINVDDIFDSN